MQSSWRLARNTLAGKPGRLALMIGAMSLATSLVVAVSCAMASLQAAMEAGLVKFLGAADARIIHPANGRFDESLLELVRSWPEVEAASGRLGASITLIRADRKTKADTGQLLRCTPGAYGVEFDVDNRFRAIKLQSGRAPQSHDEILIDVKTAQELQAVVGDSLEIQRFGPPIRLRVAGIYEREILGAVQRPLIEIDRTVLAEAAGRPGQLTSIWIILKGDRDVAEFCARHQSEVPAQLMLEPSEMVRSGFDRQLMANQFGLTIASMLTFMSAAFIIVTALTTSVTERQRELAVVRCIGGSRGQIFASQLFAGLVLSIAGAFLGIPLGIALTQLLVWNFSEFLSEGVHVHPLGIRLAGIGALCAGVLSAVYPAWMASRVSPIEAMAYRAKSPKIRSLVWCALVAVALIALQLALLALHPADQRFFAYTYFGLPAVYIGYFILAVPLVVIVVCLLSAPLGAILRLPRDMLLRSILATPFRNGFTAGALMVGISILVSSWSNMESLMEDWIGKIKFADGFAFRTTGILPHEQRGIAALPFVRATCPIGYLPVRVYDRQIFGVKGLSPPNVTLVGFDPDVFFQINAIEWLAGDPATSIPRLKDGTGAIVADRFLTTQRVKLGDKLKLGVGRVQREFEIVGAVSAAGLDIATQLFGIRSQYMEFSISMVFVDFSTVANTFDNHDAYILQINFDPAVDDEEIERRISEIAPGVQFKSGRFITKTVNEISHLVLAVESTVAFAALLLASLGMGNVIMAGIHGRQFEFGVLRAVGAHRSTLAKLILGEVAILAITGALAGTMLGLHLAWVGARFYRDLAGLPVQFTVPEVPTALGWAALLITTMLTALPAIYSITRRAPSALLSIGRNG
jgi:putative ABC transport system permease protein